MLVKNARVFQLIDKIKEHFSNNIYNRFLRKALLTMQLPPSSWEMIDSIVEKAEFYKAQGYQLDELYDRILACAQFVFHARKEVMPNIRILLASGGETMFVRGGRDADTDKVLTELAINNFPVNLKIFADMINELYLLTVELDKEMHKNKSPLFEKIPELKNIGQYLVF